MFVVTLITLTLLMTENIGYAMIGIFLTLIYISLSEIEKELKKHGNRN